MSGLPPQADGGIPMDMTPKLDSAPECVSTCTDANTLAECPATGTTKTMVTCAQGCTSGTNGASAHCAGLVPSGSVTQDDYIKGTNDATLDHDATFNTDTGAISGAITRAAGTGVINGIYFHVVAQSASKVGLGIFGFQSLTLSSGATLHAQGGNALALAVGDHATVSGTIDLQGQCGGSAIPGPAQGPVAWSAPPTAWPAPARAAARAVGSMAPPAVAVAAAAMVTWVAWAVRRR